MGYISWALLSFLSRFLNKNWVSRVNFIEIGDCKMLYFEVKKYIVFTLLMSLPLILYQGIPLDSLICCLLGFLDHRGWLKFVIMPKSCTRLV